MKKIITIITFIFISTAANAQLESLVNWSYFAKKINKTEAQVYIKATIEPGWHIYSQFGQSNGPVKTSFVFTPSNKYVLNGKTIEPKPISKYEKVYGGNVNYFEGSVVFVQKIKLKTPSAVVKGKLVFMTCDDKQCRPEEEIEFSIPVK